MLQPPPQTTNKISLLAIDDEPSRVIANHQVTICDTSSFTHSGLKPKAVYGIECSSEHRHLKADGTDSNSLRSQSFASYEEGDVLTFVPNLKEEHLDEEHEVLINFGGDVLESISGEDLAEGGTLY